MKLKLSGDREGFVSVTFIGLFYVLLIIFHEVSSDCHLPCIKLV